MKKLIYYLSVILILIVWLTSFSCGIPANTDSCNTYTGQFAFEAEWNSRKYDVDISVTLMLDNEGEYTFRCAEQFDYTPRYFEKGTYTISEDEIVLVPVECQTLSENITETKVLTADEQADMTTRGTFDGKTVSAVMRWNDSVWELTHSMELKLAPEAAPAKSKAHAEAQGTYKGQSTVTVLWGPDNKIKSSHDIRAELQLNQDGTYSYICGYLDSRQTSYCENGTYTISGDEITLIPDECLSWAERKDNMVMQTLSGEEQNALTTKGTLSDGVFTAEMRWIYLSYNELNEIALTCEE